jgi:hypothetical protein
VEGRLRERKNSRPSWLGSLGCVVYGLFLTELLEESVSFWKESRLNDTLERENVGG